MDKIKTKNQTKARRHRRTRVKIFGTAQRPRLSVFRSLNHIYAQLINDDESRTILSVKDLEAKAAKTKIAKAAMVGKMIAEKALAVGVKEAVFDRGHFKYHGRVKAVAEGAREGGLKI